jgi:hypothetical protein
MTIVKSFKVISLISVSLCFSSQIASCKEKEKSQNINNQTVNKKSDILELEKTIMLPELREGLTTWQ